MRCGFAALEGLENGDVAGETLGEALLGWQGEVGGTLRSDPGVFFLASPAFAGFGPS